MGNNSIKINIKLSAENTSLDSDDSGKQRETSSMTGGFGSNVSNNGNISTENVIDIEDVTPVEKNDDNLSKEINGLSAMLSGLSVPKSNNAQQEKPLEQVPSSLQQSNSSASLDSVPQKIHEPVKTEPQKSSNSEMIGGFSSAPTLSEKNTSTTTPKPSTTSTTTSSGSTYKGSYSSKPYSASKFSKFGLFGILSTLFALIAFIIMLSTKATVAYHIENGGSTVSYEIYTTLKMSSYFGGFMIFLFVVDLLASLTITIVAKEDSKSGYSVIAPMILDLVMMIGLFVAKSKVNSFTFEYTSSFRSVVDSITIPGVYSFGIFLIIAAFILHIVALIFVIKENRY